MKYAMTLPGGAQIKLPVNGRYLTMKTASADVVISGLNQEVVHLGAGESYDIGQEILRDVNLQNSSAVANTFELEITKRPFRKANQNTLTVNTTATISNANQNLGKMRVLVPAGGSAIVATAKAGRKSVRLSILSTEATDYLLIGDSAIVDNYGGTLERGQTDYMDTEDAVYAFNPSVEDCYVYVMELNRV